MLPSFNGIFAVCASEGRKVRTLRDVHIPPGTRVLRCEGLGLESLEGCPDGVEEVQAANNQLTNPGGLPESVIRLDVSRNAITSLEGCPSRVRFLRVSSNPLPTLKGCPDIVESLGCSYTHITNFEGCSPSAKSVVCAFSLVHSFKGLPARMDRLYASYNYIDSWDHCPQANNLDVSCNLLTDVGGVPEGITELCVSNNPGIRSLLGCPDSVRLLRVSGCSLGRDGFTDVWPYSDNASSGLLEVIECGKNCLAPVDLDKLQSRCKRLIAPAQRRTQSVGEELLSQ
jgi:hypothetical protein